MPGKWIGLTVLLLWALAMLAGCRMLDSGPAGGVTGTLEGDQEAETETTTETPIIVTPDIEAGGDVQALTDILNEVRTLTSTVQDMRQQTGSLEQRFAPIAERIEEIGTLIQETRSEVNSMGARSTALENSLTERIADEIGSMRDLIQNVTSTVQNYGISPEDKDLWEKWTEIGGKVLASVGAFVVGMILFLIFLPSPVKNPLYMWIGCLIGVAAMLSPILLWHLW